MARRIKVRKRKDRAGEHYFIRLTIDGKKRYFGLGDDEPAAVEKANRILARYRGMLAVEEHAPVGLKNMDDAVAAYVHARRGEVSAEQHALIGRLLRVIADTDTTDGRVGGMALGFVVADHLRIALEVQRFKGWGPYSIQHATTYARAMMRWLVRTGALKRSPWQSVKVVMAPRKKRTPLTREDVAALIAAAGTPKSRALLELLYETAARPSEILRARWEEVDLRAGTINAPEHKTAHRGKSRTLYLGKRAVEIVEGLPQPHEGLLFPSRRTGGVMKRTAPLQAMKRARAHLGPKFASITPYDFRHARATHLIAAGTDPATVAMILGNKPSMVLDVYTWPAPDHVRRALDGQ